MTHEFCSIIAPNTVKQRGFKAHRLFSVRSIEADGVLSEKPV